MNVTKFGIGAAAAASLLGSGAFAQAQIQPVQPTSPTTKPAPVSPQPPEPVRPTPLPGPDGPQIQPPRPQPPRPVTPRPPQPPQHDYEYTWRHHYRPPHHVGWNQAMLFSGHFGRGHYMTVRRNIPDLRRFGFNDRARSLFATGRWMVCSGTNYRGTCRTFRGRQGSLGSLNGRVSSIRFIGR